ncbi:UNVERIFIED_CONTAM: Retrovirus-related Pol polyprotein from transposon.6 [Sesamum radiatum]|uniref:Retrovirus-related Pol polyprotein from transposon.6 n=1 Tax=Sesamum radiatum TaxID=300843 RepID=A0AAW2R197_SESRA
MKVDIPNKESNKNFPQQEDQRGVVSARVQPAEELLSIQLVPGEPDKIIKIGSQLSPILVGQLTTFLQQNANVFTWIINDLIGIDPSIAVYSLNVDPIFPPVKHKKRHFGSEKDKIIQEELIDASQDYHQIMLNPDDQKRVSFVTSGGTYCYIFMPFGLKNAGATYQQLVDRMFREQLRRYMEVYVDDLLVKSRQMDQHLADLAETFDTLRRFHMKLNSANCTFGVRSGKFLGYIVVEKGIEVNPEKIRAIQEMKPPANLNEVQRLAGRIAALSRFISRSAEWSLSFFKALRKTKDFIWDEDCQQAFRYLKAYLAQLPLLTKPTLEGNEGNGLLHVDGSSTIDGSGAGEVLTSPEGDELEYALHFDFKALNKEAEYEALIAGIRMFLDADARARNLIAYTDY